MKISIGALKEQEKQIQTKVVAEGISLDEIRYVAGFEVKFYGNTAVVAVAVLDFKTMEVVERNSTVTKAPMNYIPGLIAFREGPLIMQLYYDLEYEPDVILIDGDGILHPSGAGIACYVGVELAKPTIGVAKNLSQGKIKEEQVLVEGEVKGQVVKTREHSNPLYVSVGHMISLENAAEVIKKTIKHPHKFPEPLHIARRIAAKNAKNQSST